MNRLQRDWLVEAYLEHPTRFEDLLRLLRDEMRLRRYRECPTAREIELLFEAMYDRLQELEGVR
jgi:hypothetical protein